MNNCQHYTGFLFAKPKQNERENVTSLYSGSKSLSPSRYDEWDMEGISVVSNEICHQ